MEDFADIPDRRTSADAVFDRLQDDIVSLRLLPGARMSEADIAARFGVSRQPVREAFGRLGNLGLLRIRPQKATEVARFSHDAIVTARFLRAAIEVEVARRAAARWTDADAAAFDAIVSDQDAAVRDHDIDAFHRSDLDFHRQLCATAAAPFAFGPILENKAKLDRLCVLSMMEKDAMARLVADHRDIVVALAGRDGDAAETAIRRHLSRLDETIGTVRARFADYFE